ncbi:LytTR family DNA-binding domain-containing protein [Curvibacter sp. HBC61]|uniref:LytTR family DNA-binding domain-containing protein n=1 Tax=Curvibacter cyanobacteriorum TaxID=3026422 RepID=A0ABT5MWR0_9BURK|nr:LytTR family DNA-binding domain-containing protein [Curvibacter sp. HBC61]MDD0838450.1 LytTR family DNA-binding domain-containing protein [Curvibacter sp. HBC61]
MELHYLIVDDESLARSRLRALLSEYKPDQPYTVQEAANAVTAMGVLDREPIDVVLLDIHMPGTDGLGLANHLRILRRPPVVIFVTAHAEHAVQAFDLDAVDYLTKPVRSERLRDALAKAERRLQAARGQLPPPVPTEHLIIQDRGRTERVPLAEVLYFKAELKYVTVRTAVRSYILDGSLSELESRYSSQFMRIHRNALVARHAVRALEKHFDAEEGDGWAVRLQGLDERLSVSRRQLAAVREAISAN